MNTELRVDVLHVGRDGVRAYRQLPADLDRTESLRRQYENLALTGG